MNKEQIAKLHAEVQREMLGGAKAKNIDLQDIIALCQAAEHSLSAQDEVLTDDRKSCCGHDSDCAVHNAPAYAPGPCDCSLSAAAPSPAVAMEPVAQMICPSCGKNRFKETCPSDGHCPMIADAHSATQSPSLAVRDVVDMEDPIMIPRGLVGAACYLIRKHAPDSKLLGKLRAFTIGRNEKPNADCSGDPANCPDNEGHGCACDPMNKAAMREPQK